jgi:hypothetical protein
MDKRVRTLLIVAAALVLAGVVAGVAWATIPDGTGTIHACYSASDKSLRVIDTGGCAKGEAPVSWNQNAVQGPQGPQGNQGPQGDTGPQGLAGLTYASTQSGIAITDPVIGGFSTTLTCPAGQKALNGGWFWLVLFGGSKMDQPNVESEPIGDDSWVFAAGANSTYTSQPMAVSLTCVYAN